MSGAVLLCGVPDTFVRQPYENVTPCSFTKGPIKSEPTMTFLISLHGLFNDKLCCPLLFFS